jgi:hypothetical protein
LSIGIYHNYHYEKTVVCWIWEKKGIIADLGSKKGGVGLDFWGKLHEFMKILIGKRPFIGPWYIKVKKICGIDF